MLKNDGVKKFIGYVTGLGYDSETKTLELRFDRSDVDEEEIRKIKIERVTFVWKKKEERTWKWGKKENEVG